MKRTLIVCFLVSSLLGCATAYVGPMPNLELSGNTAKEEIKKFTLGTGAYLVDSEYFEMGEQKNHYWLDSLEPIVMRVSPDAQLDFKKTARTRTLRWIPLVAAFAVIFLVKDPGVPLLYWGLLGASFGIDFYTLHEMNEAADHYNQDLVKKFVPSLSLNVRY